MLSKWMKNLNDKNIQYIWNIYLHCGLVMIWRIWTTIRVLWLYYGDSLKNQLRVSVESYHRFFRRFSRNITPTFFLSYSVICTIYTSAVVSARTLGQIDKIANLSANTGQQHESRKVRRTSMPSIFVRPSVYLLGFVLVCCNWTLVNVAWSTVRVDSFTGFSVTFRTISGSGSGRRGRKRKFRPRNRGLELLRRTGRPEMFRLRYDFLGPGIPGPVYWLLGR